MVEEETLIMDVHQLVEQDSGGGAVAGGHPQGGNFSHNHQSHSSPGSGGSGGYFNSHRGSNGRPGMIVITHFK